MSTFDDVAHIWHKLPVVPLITGNLQITGGAEITNKLSIDVLR